jgi:hypothetical protein
MDTQELFRFKKSEEVEFEGSVGLLAAQLSIVT